MVQMAVDKDLGKQNDQTREYINLINNMRVPLILLKRYFFLIFNGIQLIYNFHFLECSRLWWNKMSITIYRRRKFDAPRLSWSKMRSIFSWWDWCKKCLQLISRSMQGRFSKNIFLMWSPKRLQLQVQVNLTIFWLTIVFRRRKTTNHELPPSY